MAKLVTVSIYIHFLQVSSGLHIEMCEFGYARDLNSDDYYHMGPNKETLLPVRWTAPEAIMFGQYTTASDVWAFGITLWEIFSFGITPYSELTNSEVIQAITKFHQLPCPPNCPDGIYQLMLNCWSKMTGDRPSFDKLQKHLCNFYEGLSEQHSMPNLLLKSKKTVEDDEPLVRTEI